MASPVEKLTPRQLQALRTDKNCISVLHRKQDSEGNSDLRPITSDFSESMARAMSLYCDSQLPARSKPGAGVDLSRPLKPVLVIEGGDYEPLCKTFSWMNEYCGGRSDLPALGLLPLGKHFGLRKAAGFLGVQALVRKLDRKITQLANGHPNLEDILQVLRDYPPATYHRNRDIVADSLANALFRGVVKSDSVAMQGIRTQDPPFANMVDSLVNAKEVAKAAEKVKQAADEARAEAEKEAKRLAEEQKKKEQRAAANKVRRDQAKQKKAQLKAKQAEEAEKKRQERIQEAADAPPKRVDTSKPISSFLRSKRGMETSIVGKRASEGKGELDDQVEKTAIKPIDLDFVLPDRSFTVENPAEALAMKLA